MDIKCCKESGVRLFLDIVGRRIGIINLENKLVLFCYILDKFLLDVR